MSQSQEPTRDHLDGIGVLASAGRTQESIQESDPYQINGVAIPVDTVLQGGQQVQYYAPADVLDSAADLLEGVNIVKNFHELEGQADAEDVIGEVTDATFQEGVGLVYQGEIIDEDIAQRVAQGYLDVSPTLARSLGQPDPEKNARPIERIEAFRDLAVVQEGQPGASVEMGGNPAVAALQRDALHRAFPTGDSSGWDVLRVSEPSFNGWSEASWDAPTLEETFDGSMEDARNSATWIEGDGENFEDLKLFIVDGDGEINTNALDSAWRLASQTDGPTMDDVRRLRRLYEDLAVEAREAGAITDTEFDNVWQPRLDPDTDTNHDTGGDDGTTNASQSTGSDDNTNDTMTEETDTLDLSDEDRDLLRRIDDPERALDVLEQYDQHDDAVIVAQDEYDTLNQTIETVKEAFAELLSEDSPLSADALAESTDIDALMEPFIDDEGDLDVDTLHQSPETQDGAVDDVSGDAGESDDQVDIDSLDRSTREELRKKRDKRTTFQNRDMPGRVDALERDIAELAGAESYEDVDLAEL